MTGSAPGTEASAGPPSHQRPGAAEAGNRYAWYVVGVLVLAQMFSFLDRMIMGLLVEPIRASFQISDTQYSLLAGFMTPNRLRGQVSALFFLMANLIGLGLGPTVVAATTDYVFGRDDAIAQSIALAGGLLCPLGAFILWRGLPHIRELLTGQLAAMSEPGTEVNA